MGNIKSKNHKPSKEKDIKKSYLLLGAASTGKSVFMEQLVTPKVSYEKYKKALRNWSCSFLHLPEEFRRRMIKVCNNQLTEEILQIIKEGYLYQPTQQIDFPNIEILTLIHNHNDLWNEFILLDRFENMELFLNKCQSGEVFNPFIYSSAVTTGIRERPFIIDNESYLAYTAGGQRSIRRKWIHMFDYGGTILLFASLSEFNQSLYEDSNGNRMLESLLLYDELINSNQYLTKFRIILVFTKPDILLRKLQNGFEYNRELCYEIRPELENISIDFNVKLVVNSIVNEYSKKTSKEKFRYHIVNSLENDEVIQTMTRIIQDENSQDKTILPFISPTLLTKACYSRLKQHFMGMYPSLLDISLITQFRNLD